MPGRSKDRARVRRYSTREVARATGLCVETIRRAIRSGELASIALSPSGYFRGVTPQALEDWLQNMDGKTAKWIRPQSLPSPAQSPDVPLNTHATDTSKR